jgi:hypothetical protein
MILISKDDDNEDTFINCLIIVGVVCTGLGNALDIIHLKHVGYSGFIGGFASLLGYYIWIRRNREKYNEIKGVDPL